MKTILSRGRHRYVARVGILLVVAVLIAGLMGCERAPTTDPDSDPTPLQYDLSTSSTAGGSVTTPGEDTFTYNAETVVDLVAEAEAGYDFVNWTGDVGTIADASAASTKITMLGNYSITANFEEIAETPPDIEYELAINSTAGGSVTEPGEETYTYAEGTVVNLTAKAEEGYHFAEWTGDIVNIAEVHAAITTITMEGHYSITANFILFAGGNGTAENPYQIANWHHLDNVRNYMDGHFILMNNLDSDTAGYVDPAGEMANGDKGWQPIGAHDDAFRGSFDGQGYEIRDLFIDRPDESRVGLFGYVANGGTISNVGVVDIAVTGNQYVGGLVGDNRGTVSNSYSTGNVNGNDYVGGLVGDNREIVSMSYSSSNVTGSDYVGGLVGRNTLTLSDVYATGNVTGNAEVGGLVGRNQHTVSNSYATGGVAGTEFVGGLVGRNTADVTDSFWDTETSGQGSSAGGTGKTTAEMQNIATFSDVEWDICAVDPGQTNEACIWNIVDDETYPFLSWQPV